MTGRTVLQKYNHSFSNWALNSITDFIDFLFILIFFAFSSCLPNDFFVSPEGCKRKMMCISKLERLLSSGSGVQEGVSEWVSGLVFCHLYRIAKLNIYYC